jgi:hypothetical protein
MIHLLEPDELQRFAEAERIEEKTEREIAEICKKVQARKLTDWREASDPEAEAKCIRRNWSGSVSFIISLEMLNWLWPS